MAVRRSVDARRIASPALRALMSRRTGELAALLLGIIGLALLVALATYDPRDPSLNTATDRHVTNLAGSVGASLADILLQGFGIAGLLPGVALLAWAWRIGSHQGLGSVPGRIAALLASLPVLAGVLAAFAPHAVTWPTVAGPGGAIGSLLATAALGAGQGWLGPFGMIAAWLAGLAVAVALVPLALGLSASEWHAGWRFAGRSARLSYAGGRGAARFMVRGAGGVSNASGWMKQALARTPGLDEPPEPGTVVRRDPATHYGTVAPAPDAAATIASVHAARAPTPARKPQQQSLPLPDATWQFPSLDLLKQPPARATSGPSEEALQANARLLETVLSDYGVQGSIVEIRPGPVVTLYELEPAPGIRSARVIGLADDVARSLSVTAVRIATVPGRNVIGIEVPNARRETVFLRELLSSEEVQKSPGRLSLALGKDISGAPVVADLSRMPHLMIAGTTGSGKSVGVNAMILSLLYRLSPDQCRLILIDPKMLELSTYEGIPHLMAPVVTEPAKAVTALKWTVREMERRYRAMSQLGVRNLTGYNDRVAQARAKGEVVTRRVQTGFDPDTGRPTFEEVPLALELLPLIVVVVDEMADLMMVAGKEIEAAVQRLAQMARAAG
ncbi:MAG TPA: DNA translocase FtsK 4TM domain-containing protein, partial [Acetobacteraceae bacterium]|nr:DNA translocase FtsK 4TM domain-containing protein [Acetobacteraceae bacterium]